MIEPLIYSCTYSSLEDLRDHARGWNVEYDQVGRGRFRGSLVFSEIDSIQFSKVRWQRAVRNRCCAPTGSFCFELPLEDQIGIRRFDSRCLENNEVIVQPPDLEGEYLAPDNRHSMTVTMPRGFVVDNFGILTDESSDPSATFCGTAYLSNRDTLELRSLALQYSYLVNQHAGDESHGKSLKRVSDQMAKLLVWKICQSGKVRLTKRQTKNSTFLVKAISEFLEASDDPPVGLTELCNQFGVSLRTLDYAFKDSVGVSPAKWLRVWRLNKTRRSLLSESCDGMLIKQVAFAHGFVHLGRFSQHYRLLFGETPSETVAARKHKVDYSDN